MSNQAINPASLYPSLQMGFSQAVKSEGKVTVHISGQVAWDKDSQLVGGDDVGAQAKQALANLKIALKESGAQVSDLVRMRTYVVNHNPALFEPIGQAMGEFFAGNLPPANTWIGVQTLALPEFLIEIEATAVIA
ncbi:MAG: RidA family protein [Granulosicoccaceae bacterium]